MKLISILIPCYNEEDNVRPMAEILTKIMSEYSVKYDYEIIFRNNASTDKTLEILRDIACKDKHIKVIANARNYGIDPKKSTFLGRVKGDAVIELACDFQDPPELIPEFISWWEKGYDAVCGQKTSSEENIIKYGLRQVFYGIIDRFSDIPQYRNMSGMSLLSGRIYKIFQEHNDKYLRYFLADIGCDVKLVGYKQQKRRAGKSSYNVWRELSFAINAITSVSTAPLRLASVMGLILSFLSFVVGMVYLIYKLVYWENFTVGIAPMVIGMFFLGSVLLFFIGVVGEYVGIILHAVSEKTPPIVKELINFENSDEDPYYLGNNQIQICENDKFEIFD